MTDSVVIWQTIKKYVPRKTWLSKAEVYAIVEDHAVFDREDLEPSRYPALLPRWKANVCRVLKAKETAGEVFARRK
jgi:hypothetical protein